MKTSTLSLVFRFARKFRIFFNLSILTILFLTKINQTFAQSENYKIDSLYLNRVEKLPILKFGMSWYLSIPNIRIEKNISKKYSLESVFYHRGPILSSQFMNISGLSIIGLDLKRYSNKYPSGTYFSTGIRYWKKNPPKRKSNNNFNPDSIIVVPEKQILSPGFRLAIGYQRLIKGFNTLDLEIGSCLLLEENSVRIIPTAKIVLGFSPKFIVRKNKILKN